MISFYTESFFFLSFIGWLSLKDQRLTSSHTASEQFSTVFGYILVIYSFLWPIFVHTFLAHNFKPEFPAIDQITFKEWWSRGVI